MDSNSPNRTWVDDRVALLEPPQEWQPDADIAYERFRSSPPRRSRQWIWAAAAAVIVGALLTLPAGRAIAQRLWDLVTLKRIEVFRVNVDNLPEKVQAALSARITSAPATLQPAANADKASQRVGFSVRIPGTNVLSGVPELSTFGPFVAELTLDVEALDRALVMVGANDVRVPREWNGGRLAVQTSPVALVSYPTDITLMQALPLAITVPANVPLPALTEVALRILGLNAAQSKRLAGRMGSNPAWFFGIPHDDTAKIREVTLRSGVGTLIHSLEDDGSVQRTELIWSAPDRLYVLSGGITDELAIAVANSLN